MYIPLMLGDFKFGVDTLSFSKLARSAAFSFGENARLGGQPSLHFTGRAAQTVSLDGVVFPGRLLGENADGSPKAVTAAPLDALREIAESGQARWLVAGNGRVFGRYVVKSFSETQTAWLEEGSPLRAEFSVSLLEDLYDAATAHEAATAVLSLNKEAREARAQAFLENWKKAEEDNPTMATTYTDATGEELPTEETEDLFADPPAAGKWYLTKQGDTLSALCSQANPGDDLSAYVAQTLGENAALAAAAEPYEAGLAIFMPAQANTQSTLTTSLFESTFLSRLSN